VRVRGGANVAVEQGGRAVTCKNLIAICSKTHLPCPHVAVNGELDPTWDYTPRNERLAMQDAAQVVRDIIGSNDVENEERLLKAGEPPTDAYPVFMFAIGINWNRTKRIAHYSRVCYQRYKMDGRWNPVATLGMSQMDYIMSVLRQYEKARMAK